MSDELKPCPFCGEVPAHYAVSKYNLTPLVQCLTVGCPIDGDCISVDDWNRRAPVRVKLPQWWHEDSQGQLCLSYDAIIAALKAQGVELADA